MFRNLRTNLQTQRPAPYERLRIEIRRFNTSSTSLFDRMSILLIASLAILLEVAYYIVFTFTISLVVGHIILRIAYNSAYSTVSIWSTLKIGVTGGVAMIIPLLPVIDPARPRTMLTFALTIFWSATASVVGRFIVGRWGNGEELDAVGAASAGAVGYSAFRMMEVIVHGLWGFMVERGSVPELELPDHRQH